MKNAAFSLLGLFLLAASISTSRASDGPLIEQIIANASGNTDAGTTAQIRDYAEKNQGAIEGAVNSYRSYLEQSLSAAGDSATTPATPAAASETAAKTPPTTGLQTSGSLQTSHLDSNSHLDGYPALPVVTPVSSITNPSPAQLAQGVAVNRIVLERKRFFMRLAGLVPERN
jgi:hypothetical protein